MPHAEKIGLAVPVPECAEDRMKGYPWALCASDDTEKANSKAVEIRPLFNLPSP